MNSAEALISARASEAIYGTSQDPQGQATSQLALAPYGFSVFAWVDLQTIFKDVCAFVPSSANYSLLVFRGTKIPQDWMEDLYCIPVRFDWIFESAPGIGEIHAGFGHTLADGLSRIIAALAPCDQTKQLFGDRTFPRRRLSSSRRCVLYHHGTSYSARQCDLHIWATTNRAAQFLQYLRASSGPQARAFR